MSTGKRRKKGCEQGRTPLDLLSTELRTFLAVAPVGEAYSWGNGANYQLGSGAVGLQVIPYPPF